MVAKIPEIDVDELIADMATRLARRIETLGRATRPGRIRTGGPDRVKACRHCWPGTPIGNSTSLPRRLQSHRHAPTVAPSQLPFEVDDRNLVLVDDILYTGRTNRAAMNEFDYGRPRTISLIVLIDRSGRCIDEHLRRVVHPRQPC